MSALLPNPPTHSFDKVACVGISLLILQTKKYMLCFKCQYVRSMSLPTDVDKHPQFGIEGDLVGIISAQGFQFAEGENSTTLWEGKGLTLLIVLPFLPFFYIVVSSLTDGVPYDGAFLSEIHPNSLILQGVYYGLACVGIIYGVSLIVFSCVCFKKA